MNKYEIYQKYQAIMREEIRVRGVKNWMIHYKKVVDNPEDFYNMVWRIFEVTKLGFLPRSYNKCYGLTDADFIYESVGAHTNLALSILEHAISFQFGEQFSRYHDLPFYTPDGYSYRDMVECILMHDLAENEIGDIPDNGGMDAEEKDKLEYKYFRDYIESYPGNQAARRNNLLALFRSMQRHDSQTGNLLYLSDKVSALMVTLCLDSIEKSPMICKDSEYLSARDYAEMSMCDFTTEDGRCKASEMWAIDFFEMRHIVDLDKSFFFTALIVMATLIVNNCWYSWRTKAYVSI
ncbi:MAG: HD domain-containing protein [Candidatus Saccharibacteria bacterium]|nr:HD domain-containing protein [Candidatus Saccharibacteria bacterium]